MGYLNGRTENQRRYHVHDERIIRITKKWDLQVNVNKTEYLCAGEQGYRIVINNKKG